MQTNSYSEPPEPDAFQDGTIAPRGGLCESSVIPFPAEVKPVREIFPSGSKTVDRGSAPVYGVAAGPLDGRV
jgi:hypothetical protein